jgi:hypothetical protein
MNASQYRDHLQRVHADYRGLIDTNRLDDLAQELARESWLPSTNGSSPNQVAIEVTHAIMEDLYAAATKRDERAARAALDRLRLLILSIPSGVG